MPLEEIASVVVRRGVVHRLVGIGHLQFQPATPDHRIFGGLAWISLLRLKEQVEQILRRESL